MTVMDDRQEAGVGQVAAVELIESLVEQREADGKFRRRAVETVLDGLSPSQQREVLVGLADMASAAVVMWRKHDIVGSDLYLAMRRMLAGRMTGEQDDHDHH